jgi:hypothetical protein
MREWTLNIEKGRMFGYEGRRWIAYFWFVGWDCISAGVHVCVSAPNLELHIPFGFIRLGKRSDPVDDGVE